MQIHVMTLRFNPATEGFDDSAVTDFLRDKEVLSVNDYFFVADEVPYLTLVIRYRLASLPLSGPTEQNKPRDEAWREFLREADWPLFNTVRAWRNEHSKAAGIPPYVICTNRQLAEIVCQRPQTLAALSQIEGIGAAKLEKYGKTLLNLVAASPGPETAQPEPTDAKA